MESKDDSPRAIVPSQTADFVFLEDVRLYLNCQRCGQKAPPEADLAWLHFYGICQPIIQQTVRNHLPDEEDRHDCMQEIWQALIAQLATFQHDPSRGLFRTWLRRLARNKAIDAHRRNRRWANRHSGDPELLQWVAAVKPIPEEPDRDELKRYAALIAALKALRKRLPEKTLQVLVLRTLERRSPAETAEALGLTVEQVWKQHYRVKQLLIELLKDRSGEQ